MKSPILLVIALCGLVSASFAQKPAAPAKPNVLAPIEDAPGLPRVLLIGDSISMGYTQPVRDLLKEKANVHRIPANGGPTVNGVKKIDAWLGNGQLGRHPFQLGHP